MRLEFELHEATATLENLNTRTEKMGQSKDKVPACDLKISVARAVDDLEAAFPGIKQRYFNDKALVDLAGGIALRDSNEVYPHARGEEMLNATVHIGYGVGDPMKMEDCKLKDFKVTPMEGGTVIVDFTVQCKPDAFAQLPHLYLLQEKGITLSVKPAPLPEMKEAA